MKYTVQSSKYVLKNFLYIFPFAVIPALFLSISTDEESLIKVLKAVFQGEIQNWKFFDLFRAVSILSFSTDEAIIFGLIGLPALIVGVALMMAFLDKHFRFGKKTFNGIFSKLNDNFVSTCGYTLLVFILYELWSLLAAAFLFFASRIPVVAVAYVLGGIFFILLHILLLYVLGTIYLWLPCMQITGFPAFEALRYSYQLTTPVKWRILLGQIIVLFIAEALIGACTLFLPNPIVFTVLTTFLYALLLMTYCVRMEIAYFDRESMQREDGKKYYQR